MKIRKKIGDLGKAQIQQLVQDFLDELDEGAVALLEHFEESDSPEYLEVELDEEEKVVSFTAKDGSHYAYNLKSETIDVLNERIAALEEERGVDNFENIEDPEQRLQIGKDAEDKIFNYRKPDGTLVENAGIETNHLELTEHGMSDFQQALKDAGFNLGGGGDYSDAITNKGKKPVYIPMPRLARLNIHWDGDLTALSKKDRGGTQKVNYDVKVKCDFFDGQGVYFSKWALMSAQGNSSMAFIEKNISLKFFDTEDVEGSKHKWGKGDTFGTVFGDWVMQKTYHLKSYYTDFLKGSAVVAYQLANEVYKTRGEYADRPWKKALIDFSKILSTTPTGLSKDGTKDMNLQIDNGARCMPDGFPVIVYQNGEFYGVFVWQLKKDSDNFNLDTSEPTHIHIDGNLYASNLWSGTIHWDQFEIRNPEDLIALDGSDYDGDFPQELIGSDAVYQEGFTLNSIPAGFVGGTVSVVIGTNPAIQVQIPANASVEDVIDALIGQTYPDFTDIKLGTNTIVFQYIGSGDAPDISISCSGDNPLVFVDKVISVKYDPNNEQHVMSNTVKNYIKALATRVGQINALTPTYTIPDETVITLNTYKGAHNIDNSYSRGNWVVDPENSGAYYMALHNIDGTLETKHPLSDTDYWLYISAEIAQIKSTIETYFDIDNLIDYEVINMALGDPDGFGKNWQWVTYDGTKWYVNQYDKDMCFGNYWTGMLTTAPKTGWLGGDISLPSGIAIRYYTPEHKERWNELVEAKLFDANHIKKLISDWVARIGKDNYKQNWDKWPESPCNRNSKIDFTNWMFTGEITSSPTGTIWNNLDTYNENDVVWFKHPSEPTYYLQFKAVAGNTNKPCLTGVYTLYPVSMGYRDSVWRFFKYIEETLTNQNTFINSL